MSSRANKQDIDTKTDCGESRAAQQELEQNTGNRPNENWKSCRKSSLNNRLDFRTDPHPFHLT